MINLTKAERRKFVHDEDGAFLPLMKLVMICDDISYGLILDDNNAKGEERRAITANFAEY